MKPFVHAAGLFAATVTVWAVLLLAGFATREPVGLLAVLLGGAAVAAQAIELRAAIKARRQSQERK